MIRNHSPGLGHSCRDCRSWAGSTAATYGWSIAGAPAMLGASLNMRENWSRSHQNVILAQGSATAGLLLQATRAIPIVFVIVSDPVSAGFVDSLSRPGGNATGFLMFE